MRAWMIGLAALVLAACGEQSEQAAQPAPPSQEPLPASLAIENVTVIDASRVLENATVVISGETIAAVGATAAMTLPDTAERIDGTGKFLIPGLWDAHVHLTYYPDLTVDAWYPLLLANGITSVRDTGGLIEKIMPLRDIARTEGATAPRVFVAGPLVDGAQRVYAGLNGRPNISVRVSTAEEARTEIDRLQAAGVDLIKLYEMASPEAFAAAAARADELGLPTTAHVPLSMDAADAAATGIDGMEHLRNLELACAAHYRELLAERRETLAASTEMDGGDLRSQLHSLQRQSAIAAQDSERCQTVIRALGDNRVFQTPTLTVNTITTQRLFTQPHWQETFAYLPAAVQASWSAGAERFGAQMQPSEAGDAFTAWSLEMVKRLQDSGVPVMAGTDAPIGFLTPGYALHEELRLLTEAGLTPMQALTAATLHPAQFMGLDDKLGTVEAGKWADLVLLTADPRDDIANARAIDTVIKGGTVYPRDDLDGMLAALMASAGDNDAGMDSDVRQGGVLVLGGTGQLGSEIVKDLVEAGEKVTVLARPTSDRDRLDGLDVSYVIGDMLVDADMEQVLNGADYRAVVDASNGPWGDEDFYSAGMQILSKRAAETGVSQIILHGAIGAGDSMQMIHLDRVFDGQRVAILDKTTAEEILIDSGVPYTIIRHLTLLPIELRESGNAFLTTDRTAYGPVTRDGLARLTLECLDNEACLNTIQHGIDHDVEMPEDRVTGMKELYKRVIKEEFYVER
jgi:imidazolonepropionase-like amidohydrolase/uncharacterized protein YbjT (DUF2867 family)